jgi:hypothetical protein
VNNFLTIGLAMGWIGTTETSFEPNFSGEPDWELKDKDNMFIVRPRVGIYRHLAKRLYFVPNFGVILGFGNMTEQYVGYNNQTFEEEVITDAYKDFALGLEVNARLLYFLSERIALSAGFGSLYYSTLTQTSKADNAIKWKTNSYGVDLSPSSIKVGIVATF